MGNEDRKVLKKNVTSMHHDKEKEIEINGGAGEIGIKIFKASKWKEKCEKYFNRYYKAARIIAVPSDRGRIINAFSFLCSENQGRGFVFKNYDIVKHLEFLGYDKATLKAKLGQTQTGKCISYVAYVEQKNVIYICEKVLNGSNMSQCLNNISVIIKYFLTLYNRELQKSKVNVIGLLIRENEKQELVECRFCGLFSPSYKHFESPASFKNWLKLTETYERRWDVPNAKEKNKLFNDLAAEILCFMALQEKCLPTHTDDKSQQFKQTYLLYTPQQMDIHFSNAKHVVIQGSYGSGKSILGLKKVELIWKRLKENEKIIYLNFDLKSKLHFLMEENLKKYVRIPSRKIKRINSIGSILESPSQSIFVCHNKAGVKLSLILEETVKLNLNTLETAKIIFHLIIEEYDGETLSVDEAAKATELVQGTGLLESNIVLLAQPLTKKRSFSIDKKSYEKKTCMFHNLESTFKIVKLTEVLRCTNEICSITKSTQSFVQNKDNVFVTEMDAPFLEHEQQDNDKNQMISFTTQESNYTEMEPSVMLENSRNEKVLNPIDDISQTNESLDPGIDLDQVFKRSSYLQEEIAGKSKIISKFGFLCEPKQGVDIKWSKPNLVEISEEIKSTSDMLVISLGLVLKYFIGKNKATTVLYMDDEEPGTLRKIIELLQKGESFLHTQDIETYLKESRQSNVIFSSNFRSVNGMEFDHVVIVVSQSEYYLKCYLPQAISRCTYDLTIVLLPEDDSYKISSGTRYEETKGTVGNMIEELKRARLLKQMVVTECKVCEEDCYCLSNDTDNKQTFGVHTHSVQYKNYLSLLRECTEEQVLDNSASAYSDTK